MSDPIVVQQNADGSYDIPAIILAPYVAPVAPPSPAPPPVPPAPVSPSPVTGEPNIGAEQPGDTWTEPT